MNDIQIFKNEAFGEVRVAGTSDEPLFCLADICKVVELLILHRLSQGWKKKMCK